MNLFERISFEAKNKKIKLLCQIVISDKEYEYLIRYTKQKANSLYMQTIPMSDVLLSVALVQVAIREYSEGNYWDCFLDVINSDISQAKRNYLGQVFVVTLKMLNLFIIDNSTCTSNQYVENIKAHSFVPNNYLSGYFDFIFSFYDRNLYRQLPDEDSEDFEELCEYMGSTLNIFGDKIRIEKSNLRPSKSYKLLKATRWTIAQNEPSIVSELMLPHLEMVDNFYYDSNLPQDNDRFSKAFVLWSESMNAELNENQKSRLRKSTGHFKYKPYFEINSVNGKAILIIPEQKFREQEFNGEANIFVNSLDSKQSTKMDLYRAFGVLVSERIGIEVIDIFQEYSIEIYSASSKKFNIPSKQYRIFNEEWNEISKLKIGHCYFLSQKDADIRFSNVEKVYTNNNNENWNEYSVIVSDDSVIYINNAPISTAGEFSVEPIFEFVSREYVLFDSNQKEIQTTLRHPIVSFKINKNAIAGSFLWCNDERFNIEIAGTFALIELQNDQDNYGISVMLDKLLLLEDGVYTIVLDEAGKGKRILCKYALLTKLLFKPEKRRFTFCETAQISVNYQHSLTPLNCMKLSDGEYILDLTHGENSASFSLVLSTQTFYARVPVKLFKYGFSQKWIYQRLDYLWYSDLKNDLYVNIPGAKEASVYLDKNDSRCINGEPYADYVFKFDISEFVHEINEQTKPWRYINMRYHDNADRRLTLFRVLRTLWFIKFDFKNNDNDIVLDVEYKGNADLLVSFTEYNEKEEIVRKRKLINGLNKLPELNTNSLYIIEKFISEADDFGFSQKVTPIGRPIYKVGAINYNNLTNCKIVIKQIIYDGQPLKLEYEYLIFDLEKVADDKYTGWLTYKNRENASRVVPIKFKILITLFQFETNTTFLHMYLEESLDWAEFWYDKSLKKLISIEDDILSMSHDHNRFLSLYEDITEFKVDFRRIR